MKYQFSNARLLLNAGDKRALAEDVGGEVVFAGRSNAGKSSVINKLCMRKNLAKSSKTPGCTRTIKFYELAHARRLVDLPGYGFARQAHNRRQKWNLLIDDYFRDRNSLRCLFLIVDIRRQLMEMDWQLVEWKTRMASLPLHIILNKADLVGAGKARTILKKLAAELADHKDISLQLFSAVSGLGADQARHVLAHHLERTA